LTSHVAALLLLVPAALAAKPEPFKEVQFPVPGRPVQAWTGQFSQGCPESAEDLFVLTVEGAPPDERRRVVLLPCTASSQNAPSELRIFALENDVVAVDSDPHGHRLLMLRPEGLEFADLSDPEQRSALPFPGGLPLVPRSRGVSRIPMAGPWGLEGRPGALLPTLTGASAVDYETGQFAPIRLPMMADYATQAPGLPDPSDPFLSAQFTWPMLVPGEDDGIPGTDLFALNRWNLAVFRREGGQLPREASRSVPLRPFDATQETRPEQSETVYRAIDLNSDGLTDLALHRSWGTLMQGRAATALYLNRGEGANPDAPPDAQRELKDGFSSIEFVDLDGDGWLEGVETSIQFGLVQAVRMLLTQSGKATLEILALSPSEPHRLTSVWKQDIRFDLDFAEARVEGLYPILTTDWNGDGRKDILLVDSDGELSIRLGKATRQGLDFGSSAAGQAISLRAGRSAEADLNGDGLRDLVLYDPQNPQGAVWVYYNRGVLPGTPAAPEIKSAED